MPPVDEATFIEKADLLIARLALLAEAINDARISLIAENNTTRLILDQHMDRLVTRADEAIANARTASQTANDIEIARIKRVPLRHGGKADGVL